MTEQFNTLAKYLQYPFVQRAIAAGILIALCASLLGVTLVLKRFSFIGDGLSHVAFGAMSCAGIVGLTNSTYIVVPVTILAAVLLLRSGGNVRIKGDAAVAMISVGSLAIGYMLQSKFPISGNFSADVCTTLFGSTSILMLKNSDVWLCVGMAALVISVFLIFYNKIFAVTFDETFSRATGVRADLYNTIIAVITAIVIVMSMKLVGSLLISALIIFPSLCAMRIFRSFRSVIIFSAVLSVICALIGILVSILFSTPVGSTIVAADICAFLICWIISLFIRRSA